MPTNEVMDMVSQALQAMLIGVPGVFFVLAIFYAVLKLLFRTKGEK